MDKFFDHKLFEHKIYQSWEKSGSFTPQPQKDKLPFTIIMPPPNANDNLHVGHVRFVTIQDVLTRFYRMKGFATLWLPGADHAGIETQYVFEKKLQEKGESRFDYDRESLFKMIWDFSIKNKGVMEDQLRALGASCDWTRNKFTLDPDIVKVVYNTFYNLYSDGLVYRGERIVNFCPRCGTAFSQLEVNFVEKDDPFYYLDYKSVTIATTRPETIFADVAVAVNPKDKRFKDLIGKTATIPLINKEIPVIADELVDPEFGTGALKVTPGHDATDFEIGQTHNLETISVIDRKGRMINTPKKYLGLKPHAAREMVVKDLFKKSLVTKTQTIHHTVGTCYRDKSVIEPMISDQWFLKVKPLTEKALASVRSDNTKFASKKYKKIAVNWLTNLRDWNISRQIVWGIRIPAWRCLKCDQWTITKGDAAKKCPCGSTDLHQDSDTFDTWFSSGQWPYATLISTKPGDFEYFYPTTVMETGYDIIPFWVIRMIMLGLYSTGKTPFNHVVVHGLVRDKQGQKISKSKGNVINPLEMIEKYGADALRASLVWGALVENDVALSEDNVRGMRNFANKIWNVSRFVKADNSVLKLNGTSVREFLKLQQGLDGNDKLILKELQNTIDLASANIENFKLNEALESIYSFVWHNFADIYIEHSKSKRVQSQPVLEYILQQSLKLLHPFMPFVTEAVWSHTFLKDKSTLINQKWPS